MPDEISNLQFHNISDRSVTVVWNPPKHANGVLVGYSVLYMIKDRPDTLKSENVTENITHITINNLMVSFLFFQEILFLNFFVIITVNLNKIIVCCLHVK